MQLRDGLILLAAAAVVSPATGLTSMGAGAAGSDTSVFRPLELPAPTARRDATGKPGPGYWQQRVDYTIAAVLDTTTHSISGDEAIRYHNNSPDTLGVLWLQLDQNLYRPDSRGAERFPEVGKAKPPGFIGGYTISALAQANHGQSRNLVSELHGTMMRVSLARAVAPRDSTVVELHYSFRIPENGSQRLGRRRASGGWLYAIGQWFPRAAVYDDLSGWNTDEYLGQGEFYLEYGDIDYSIALPRSFIVVGTGHLENPQDVLTPGERGRLALAARSDSEIVVVSPAEAGSPSTRPSGPTPVLTWRFHAANVRDAAWAASPAFEWEASGWHGILLQTLHTSDANADWRHALATVRSTIAGYSARWFPYPYRVATAVAAPLESGMEYPTIVFDPMTESGVGLDRVVLHELGHQWFPMIVGSNERRHAWMDEGFDSFVNWLGIGRRATGNGRGAARWRVRGRPGPIVQPADSVASGDYDPVEYSMPDVGLELLRYEILDDSTRFDAAFKEYVRRWAFKHPSPADFFRTMNDVLHEDLSWFWREWFYTTDLLDQAVDSVTVARRPTSIPTTEIWLSSRGRMPMPVRLRIAFADGTSETVKLPVDIWRRSARYRYARAFSKDVVHVQIDPDENFPDVDRSNNAWAKSP